MQLDDRERRPDPEHDDNSKPLSDETGVPYIIEGNSAPGMNTATANRVINQITEDWLDAGGDENAN